METVNATFPIIYPKNGIMYAKKLKPESKEKSSTKVIIKVKKILNFHRYPFTLPISLIERLVNSKSQKCF